MTVSFKPDSVKPPFFRLVLNFCAPLFWELLDQLLLQHPRRDSEWASVGNSTIQKIFLSTTFKMHFAVLINELKSEIKLVPLCKALVL